MPPKNVALEKNILDFVKKNPGLHRSCIARELQQAGLNLGKQHLINRVSEMINSGTLKELLARDGKRLVYPVTDYERRQRGKP